MVSARRSSGVGVTPAHRHERALLCRAEHARGKPFLDHEPAPLFEHRPHDPALPAGDGPGATPAGAQATCRARRSPSNGGSARGAARAEGAPGPARQTVVGRRRGCARGGMAGPLDGGSSLRPCPTLSSACSIWAGPCHARAAVRVRLSAIAPGPPGHRERSRGQTNTAGARTPGTPRRAHRGNSAIARASTGRSTPPVGDGVTSTLGGDAANAPARYWVRRRGPARSGTLAGPRMDLSW
jgi:hypothetical protein